MLRAKFFNITIPPCPQVVVAAVGGGLNYKSFRSYFQALTNHTTTNNLIEARFYMNGNNNQHRKNGLLKQLRLWCDIRSFISSGLWR